ncbi:MULTISPECIES: hypothetical protein [unclassified Nocardiopsis]|uniref:hypothetical protein n=1 Tax=Nocardiopsis TaxID=2013 RepID=UPI00387AC420
MDLTLPDGYTVVLRAHTAAALLAARPFPGRDDLYCPVTGDPQTTAALIAQGLAERDPQGLLILTARGNEARAALERSATGEAPTEPVPVRPVLDPTLPAEDAERLSAALSRLAAGDTGPVPVRQPFLVALLVFAVVPMLLLYSLHALIPAWWGLLVAVGVPLIWSAGALHLTFRRQRKAEQETPPVVAASYEGRHVTPDALDDQGRALLARTQQAVDTVLESGLHREGLLLDSVRNQVVLAETEWTIARGLGDLARSLREIEATPITGERSRAAAERARVALAEERGHLERRIELLEEYADRVRAADDERTDSTSAHELGAITDRVIEAGAARDLHDESLASLVRAQEAALRLSELTEDR